MSRRDQSGSPKVPKKEYCSSCAASGQPCVQDTNPAGMPAETTDTRQITVLYRRPPACEHQETEDERRLSPIVHEKEPEQHSNHQTDRRLSGNGQPVTKSETNDTGLFVRQDSSSSSTSTDYSSYCELRNYVRSEHLLTQSRSCATCKLLMEGFSCEDSKIFWMGIPNEGPDIINSCHKKFFGKFEENLRKEFQEEEGLNSKCTINLLKQLLKVNSADKTAAVNLSDVIRIIELFGPLRLMNNKCILINQLHDLVRRSLKARDKNVPSRSSWFVGDMTRSEAEAALSHCKDKTYLIRISGTDGGDGDFALSVLHEDHCHHLKIQGNPKQALAESDYNAHLKFAGHEFSSLPDVVDYITANNDIEIEQNGGDEYNTCKYVTCLRVYLNSPLNGPMSGYEKTKKKR